MPLASARVSRELTPEERRERRALRREKQRENNILRAAKMHKFRLKLEDELALNVILSSLKILTRSAPCLGLEGEIAWPQPSLFATSRAPIDCRANSLLRHRNAGRARRPPERRRRSAELRIDMSEPLRPSDAQETGLALVVLRTKWIRPKLQQERVDFDAGAVRSSFVRKCRRRVHHPCISRSGARFTASTGRSPPSLSMHCWPTATSSPTPRSASSNAAPTGRGHHLPNQGSKMLRRQVQASGHPPSEVLLSASLPEG